MKHIAIIDFGSQYTHLIARSIREMKVLAKIYHEDVNLEELKKTAEGIILSGGPQSIYDKNSPKINKQIFDLNLPILGICYGHQLIADYFGGKVKPGESGEYGRTKIFIEDHSGVFENVSRETQIWMSHWDEVSELPEGFRRTAYSEEEAITAMANSEKKIYSVQFHPEVEHSVEGGKMLENFVLRICQAPQDWKVENLVDDLVGKIKKQVGNKKVFILVSGGVDSNVAFALLNKALGKDRVIGLYINNGFMRLNESERLKERFERLGYDNLRMVDASETFLRNVENIFEPEEKRKIIGQTFLDIKDAEVDKLELESEHWILGQGTIYPDIVESGGTKHADKIKTHHNRVDAIQELIDKGLVIEPLDDFYKDEVRKIGKMLDLPPELVDRHPFPGPGLSIRCLCYRGGEVDDITIAQEKVSAFVKENFQGLNERLLPIKSVGVQGDNRTYAHPLVLWGKNEWDELDDNSSKITNALREVNRCLLWLNPQSDVKFKLVNEDSFLTKERLDILREVDDIVTRNIREAGVYDEIWQFPVVMIPITQEGNTDQRESIVLRPIVSRDAMTLHFYPIQKELLQKIVEEILATEKVSNVFFDITNKPPGTIEWE